MLMQVNRMLVLSLQDSLLKIDSDALMQIMMAGLTQILTGLRLTVLMHSLRIQLNGLTEIMTAGVTTKAKELCK